MEPISLHLHAVSQSHCVLFITKNRLIYYFRLPNCRQLFPVLPCFYSRGYATHWTVVFRKIYPPTNFNFRFRLMIAGLLKTVDVNQTIYLSKALQIFASIQRDAEDCYFVILLRSSFFKYLPFHIWLYHHI